MKTNTQTNKKSLVLSAVALSVLVAVSSVSDKEINTFGNQVKSDKLDLSINSDPYIRTGSKIDVVVRYKETGQEDVLQIEESELKALMQDPRFDSVEPDIAINVPRPDTMPEMSFETRMVQDNNASSNQSTPYSDPWSSNQSYFFDKKDTSGYTMEFFPAKEKLVVNKTVRVGVIDDSFFQTKDLVYSEGANFHNGDGDTRGNEYLASQAEMDTCLTMHGPAVAQMVLGISDNGDDGAGVIDDYELVVAKALRCGSGSLFSAALAIRWMAGENVGYGIAPISEPVDVMNLSLGGEVTLCPSYMQRAIDTANAAGILVVAAAGNNNKSVTASGFAPAVCDGVLTVGSVDMGGNKSHFSNYDETLEIMAIGEGIIGPHKNYQRYGNYASWNGTSMAAPMVMGAYAMLKQTYPDITPEEGIQYIQMSATLVANTDGRTNKTCGENQCGAGILNANKMMASAHLMRTVGTLEFVSGLNVLTPCDQEVVVNNAPDPVAICSTVTVTISGTSSQEKAVVSTSLGGDLSLANIVVQGDSEMLRLSGVDALNNDYGVRFCDDETCATGVVLPIDASTLIVPAACD